MKLFLWSALAFTLPWFAVPASTLMNFEDLADGTILFNQYPNLTLTNAIVLTAGIGLNEFEFPPHSGSNVVTDNGGPMSITFSGPVERFAGHFVYLKPLTLRGFDAQDREIARATSAFSKNLACPSGPPCPGDIGSSPNELLQLSSGAGITRITITGDVGGSSFALDDVTIVPIKKVRGQITSQ